MSQLTDDVARLSETAAKLLHEVGRLHRDVVTLLDRVQPYDGERREPSPPYKPEPKPRWTVVDALNVIRSARGLIENCERDLAAIRARIDSISDDVHSREELKPFLRESRRRDGD